MVGSKTFAQMALSFEGATEAAHFEKRSFRVSRRIFATLDEKTFVAVLKLPASVQSVFCSFNPEIFYPANGSWGRQGWTVIALKKVKKSTLQDALKIAFCHVAPKKLSAKYDV